MNHQAINQSINTTVRLWVWHRGAPVRVTLRNGVPIHFGYGKRTEEGWDHVGTRMHLEGERITLETTYTGVDCDGLLTVHEDVETTVGELHDRALVRDDGTRLARLEDTARPVHWPRWHLLDHTTYDARAEEANY